MLLFAEHGRLQSVLEARGARRTHARTRSPAEHSAREREDGTLQNGTRVQMGALQRWEKEFKGFRQLFLRFLQESPLINWNKIKPPQADLIRPYDKLPATPAKVRDARDSHAKRAHLGSCFRAAQKARRGQAQRRPRHVDGLQRPQVAD